MDRAEREASFIAFVEARHAQLRRIAYALCGDWNRADDLVQNAWVKLYVAWPRVHWDGQEDAYVRRILLRANIDDRRRAWRRWERTKAELPESVATDDSEGLPEREALFEALQQLPAMQRKVVVLRFWLGSSVRDTATDLGISEGTVKSHSARALHRLQGLLDETPERDPATTYL